MKIHIEIRAESCPGLEEEKATLWLTQRPEGKRSHSKLAPVPLTVDGFAVWLKRECYPSLYEKLRGWHRFTFFGLSKSHSEWKNLLFLEGRGIPVATPLGFGERRSFFLEQGFLLTRHLHDTQNLDQWAPAHATARDQKRRLIMNLADVLARMHQNRFFYRDLHWRNVLVDGRENIFLIDCPKGKQIRWRWWMRFCAARDMGTLDTYAAFYFTRRERMRFLRHYCAGLDLSFSTRKLKYFLLWVKFWQWWTLRKDRKKKRSQYFLHAAHRRQPQDRCPREKFDV